MPDEFSQDDIDKLLSEVLGDAEGDASAGISDPTLSPNDTAAQSQMEINALLSGAQGSTSSSGPQNQDDIDSLLANALSGGNDSSSNIESNDGPQSQDDIDALIAGALGGDSIDDNTPAAAPAPSPAPVMDDGPQSQDDIDALIAGALGGDFSDADETPVSTPAPSAAPVVDEGPQSQDDIDALLAGALGGDFSDADETPVSTPAPSAAPVVDEGPQSQDDIDALLAGALGDIGGIGDTDETAEEEDTSFSAGMDASEDDGTQSQDDIDALLAGALGDTPFEAQDTDDSDDMKDTTSFEQGDLDALLAGTGMENDDSGAEDVLDSSDEDLSPASNSQSLRALAASADGDDVDSSDMASLLLATPDDESDLDGHAENEDAEDFLAAVLDQDNQPSMPHVTPPPAQPKTPRDSARAPMDMADASADILAQAPPPGLQDILSGTLPPEPPLGALSRNELSNIRQSLSLMESATEVEGITTEISGLLGTLSERARRYQCAWQTASHEGNDLRNRLLAAERKSELLLSEKAMLKDEVDGLQRRIHHVEQEMRTKQDTDAKEREDLRAQLRDRDNRIKRHESEIEALSRELEEVRAEMADLDLLSRRAKFEVERHRSDLDAERQERLRLQRTLENREKELNAMRTRTAGQATGLFLDELHRLVRRLEHELDLRTSAARDALAAVDRIPSTDHTEHLLGVMTRSLRVASGLESEPGEQSDDALSRISRQAERFQSTIPEGGPAALTHNEAAPVPSMDDFALDLQMLDLDEARVKASRMLADGMTTPFRLMNRVYTCSILRDTEVKHHLAGLVMLLQNLRQAQVAQDKAVGKESSETESLYVMLFDLLHSLVRNHLIDRNTAEAWDLFYDVRGRYSFITSDQEWFEYRDRQLV